MTTVPFDVVALVTSAGGLDALTTVLRDLPAGLPTTVLIVQHLSGQGSTLVEILARRTTLPVAWVEDGGRLEPGRVLVGPPRKFLEVLPDRTFALSDNERGARDSPFDFFLKSLADSLGPRALAVVLSGMGKDGAMGARALKQAGGTVVAQSEETAAFPSMPMAAVESGATDLVLPLHEIGTVLGRVLAGGRFPRPRNEIEAIEALFGGPGEARAALREVDWSTTSLGPVMRWSGSRRGVVRAVLDSGFPMLVFWGADLVQIGNDALAPLIGGKRLQGLPGRATWGEFWAQLRPQIEQVARSGEAVWREDELTETDRHGFLEEAYFTYAQGPLHEGEQGVGVLTTWLETTGRVLATRRLATLHALGASLVGAETAGQVCERAARALEQNPRDVPFALLYLLDGDSRVHLCFPVGLEAGSPAAPHTVDLRRDEGPWPLGQVMEGGWPVSVEDLPRRLPGLHAGPWPQSPTAALLLPLRAASHEQPIGCLVVGLSPRLGLTTAYRGFLELVMVQVSASLAETRTRQKERDRLEQLAELDRTKTEFFSNVSHEFRTPLTLLLAPLEELQRQREQLPVALAAEIELASRNARRLLSLVNALLDLSQLEAGRMRTHLESTDLAALTTDIASFFRSAAERAGLALRVTCSPLPEPVWVDRSMWEKIVSNLLSNALKFTFEGSIEVELRQLAQHVELVVRDTGVGIPEAELPHLFKRFHRVRGLRARSEEGTGIGLALVQELVRLHHGRVRVRSQPGKGTTFTVWLSARLQRRPDRPPSQPGERRLTSVASAMAETASRWDTDQDDPPPPPSAVLDSPLDLTVDEPLPTRAPGARVLVVDDNADMRDYLRRLLASSWQVEVASNGQEALEAAHRVRPDLIVADVRMPVLDGLAMMRQLRQDPSLRAVPVILVTAQAGEEAAIEGLLAGADDYLVKPFSARELIARVGGQLELARVRRRAEELNAFLVRFSDAVRGLGDASAVAQAACDLVAERLGVERAYWAEVDWASREYVIGASFHLPDVPVIAGRFPVDAWEPFTSNHLAGQPVVVDDTQADPRIPAEVKRGYAQIAVGADLAVPVKVGGRLVCTLAVNQRLPRRWTVEEVSLVENVATRCWTEVERARAEEALRASEARYRALATASADVLYRMNPDWSEMRQLDGRGFLEDTPASGELSGTWLERYIHPDDRERVTAAIREAVANKVVFALEHRVTRVDGTLGWTSSRAVPLLGADGEIVEWLGAASDVTLRHEAEAALRESEEKYRRLFETMGHGFIELEVIRDERGHPVDLLYLELNPAFERQFGVPVAYARGKRASEFFPGFDPDWTQAFDRVARTGQPERIEQTLVEGRWFEVFAYPAAGARVAAFYEDVSERKRAEAALRASEERLRRMINVEGVGVLLFDAAGTVLDSNDFFLRLIGYPRRAIESGALTWRTMTPPEHVATSEAQLEALGRTGRIGPYEKEYVHADGTRSWLLFAGAALGDGTVVEYCLDVSDRKHAEAALRASEEKYRTLFETMGQGYALVELVRDEAGRAVDLVMPEVNHAFERLFGVPAESVRGRRMVELFPEQDRWWLASYDRVVRAGRPERLEHQDREGGRWFEAWVYPREGDRFVAVFEDITERKRREFNAAVLAEIDRDLALLSTPDEIIEAVGARLGRSLHLSGCIFADVDEASNEATVHHGWNTTDVASLKQTFRLADYFGEEFRCAGRAGETVVVRDTARDARTDAEAYADLRIGSFVTVPFLRQGRWVANLTATTREPRDWHAQDIELLQEIASRVIPRVERARAEAALRESESRARAIVANLPGGAAFVVDHDLRYQLAGGEAFRAAGFTTDAFVGRTLDEVLEPALVVAYTPHYHQAFEGASFEVEHTSHGRTFLTRGAPLRDEADRVTAVLAVSIDVTERRQAEDALRENEKRQAFLLELTDALRHIGDATAIQSMATRRLGDHLGVSRCVYAEVVVEDGQEWTIVQPEHTTPGFARLAGRHPSAAFGSVVQQLREGRDVVVPDTEAEHETEALQQAYRRLGVRARLGVPLVKAGRLVGVLGVHHAAPRAWTAQELALVREVAERTWAAVERARAEAAMRASEARLALIFARAPVGLSEIASDGRFVKVNDALCRLVGRTPEAMMALTVADVTHPDDVTPSLATATRVLATGEPALLEKRYVRPDGVVVHAESSLTRLDAEAGRAPRLLVVTVDRTAHKLLEAERAHVLAREQEARREAEGAMVLRDEFLTVISHELRTPLSSILLWSKVLREGEVPPDHQDTALASIEASALAQKKIVEALLDVSTMLSGKMPLALREVELAPLVVAAVTVVQPMAAAREVTLTTDLGGRALGVRVDPDRLQQVVWNLVNNAVKFTPSGGRVAVRLGASERFVRIVVEDTGQGIAPDFLPHVFERFRQQNASITRTHGGLGLGLAIARQLVELHGGTLRATSAGEGRGATFTVELPRHEVRALAERAPTSKAGESTPAPGPRPDATLAGKRLLLVEDEDETREALRWLLERSGAHVTDVGSVDEALAAFDDGVSGGRPRFDMLITDIGLPVRDGYTLLAALRQRPEGAALPALALTAYARHEDRQRALAAGFQAYLAKPIEPRILIEAVTALARGA